MDYKALHEYKSRTLPPKGNYNQYFNPNICHVCKLPDNGNLMPCKKCGLISYCRDEHKEEHTESHKDICVAMAEAKRQSLDLELNAGCNLEDWIKSRKELISFAKHYIKRDLKPYEVEMIICAKSCFFCHKRTDLRTCKICYYTNCCTDHEKDFREQHTSCRNDLLVLHHINFLSMYENPYWPYPEHIKFVSFPGSKPYSDMNTFINNYVLGRTKFGHPSNYVYSDYMSTPLTLYHACKQLDILDVVKRSVVIHILGASAADVTGIKAWEIFKHLCKNIREMYVVMIKSDTNFDSYEYKDMCSICRYSGPICKFYFENVTLSYHDYVNTASYKQPNVIIGSLPRDKPNGGWHESLGVILSQNCPILVTARSQNEIEEMENMLRSVIDFGEPFSGVNIYRGLRPYRDYETGGIIYHNHYVMMFSKFEFLAFCDPYNMFGL